MTDRLPPFRYVKDLLFITAGAIGRSDADTTCPALS
jgi:hypothetical protein